jgi:hypothetical protein
MPLFTFTLPEYIALGHWLAPRDLPYKRWQIRYLGIDVDALEIAEQTEV